MKGIRFSLTAVLLSFSLNCAAEPHYGVQLSLPVFSTEPSPMHGFQIFANYDPDIYKWRQFNVYFDAGFTHFYQNQQSYYSGLNIYSIAPVVRYSFKRHWQMKPYLELSVGVAYLNHTRIENRNLGIHFSFQDRIGVGVLLGKSEKVTVGVHVVHYSNSRLSSHNSGISVPLVFDIGYRFG